MNPANIVDALTVLVGVLTLIEQGTETIKAINETIQKARDENRDISDEELAAIKAKSQEITDRVLAKLRSQP